MLYLFSLKFHFNQTKHGYFKKNQLKKSFTIKIEAFFNDIGKGN